MDEFMEAVKRLWVLERHVKGALGIRQLMDVLERNYGRWEKMEKDPAWEILGLFKTVESARAAELELKRKTAELMAAAQERLEKGATE